MRSCVVTVCKDNTNGFCPRLDCLEYTLYRKVTGRCDTCGLKMAGHPMCAGCGALCGSNHDNALPIPYRGRNLCPSCYDRWQIIEKVIGREATWEEFLSPQPKMFPKLKKNENIRGK